MSRFIGISSRIFLVIALLAGLVFLASFSERSQAAVSYCSNYYTVRWGDTLYSIGYRYGVNPQTLMAWNNLWGWWAWWIYPGQVLCVAKSYTNPYWPPTYCNQYYTIQWGDTLSRIGWYFGVSWVYLANLNQISNPNLIYAGNTLCIR